SAARARASRRWSSTSARSATASPSCARSSSGSRKSSRRVAPSARAPAASLDTTVRAIHPETKPRLLVSDTVGFITKLPHDLVASFRSTLDEALEAGLLLYVADASDPTFRAQLDVTRTVLKEIGAGGSESALILNKADRVAQTEREELLQEFPAALLVSAKD